MSPKNLLFRPRCDRPESRLTSSTFRFGELGLEGERVVRDRGHHARFDDLVTRTELISEPYHEAERNRDREES